MREVVPEQHEQRHLRGDRHDADQQDLAGDAPRAPAEGDRLQAIAEAGHDDARRIVEVGLHRGGARVALGGIAAQRAQRDLLGLPARGAGSGGAAPADRRACARSPPRTDRRRGTAPGRSASCRGWRRWRRRRRWCGRAAGGSARAPRTRPSRWRGPAPPKREAPGHHVVRQAEVDEADRSVGAEHHVARLEVVVDEPAAVQVVDGGADLTGDAQRLRLGQRALVAQPLVQRLAGDELGRHVVALARRPRRAAGTSARTGGRACGRSPPRAGRSTSCRCRSRRPAAAP